MTKIKKLIFVIAFGVLSYSLTSCGGVKLSGASKNINKYIEEFYIGDGVIQYFIQPIPYTDNNNQKASLDGTFRNYDKTKDSIAINFTTFFKTEEKINKIILDNKTSKLTINKVKTLFREKDGDLFTHRSSFKIRYQEYLEYLLNENHEINVFNTNETVNIYPNTKGKNTIVVLNEKISSKVLN